MSSESFFLPTNKEEIVKRDAPITKLSFRRIQPQQTAVEDSFYGSTHSFKFSNSSPLYNSTLSTPISFKVILTDFLI